MNRSRPSKSEIDRLGERLRISVSREDLQLLDAHRLSFAVSYQEVLTAVRELSGVAVSGRPAKSTTAIVDKLKRESTRLSQIQDIAGCRVVVGDVATQDAVTTAITSHFNQCKVFDRRVSPSHGYKAVHIVVSLADRLIEVQVRTGLQHLWAELSEKLADNFGFELKYGSGPVELQKILQDFSLSIAVAEGAQQIEGALQIVSQITGITPPLGKHAAELKLHLTEFSKAIGSKK